MMGYLRESVFSLLNTCKGALLVATIKISPPVVFRDFMSLTSPLNKNPETVGKTGLNAPLPFPFKIKP
jgi:hypothetical protein